MLTHVIQEGQHNNRPRQFKYKELSSVTDKYSLHVKWMVSTLACPMVSPYEDYNQRTSGQRTKKLVDRIPKGTQF